VTIRLLLGLALLAALAARPAWPQEFALPSPAPSLDGDLLERGLPGERGGVHLLALHVRRPLGFTTRALAAEAGLGVVRGAFGLARSGDSALGWSTAAAAVGFAAGGGGAALRGAIRRDDAAPFGEDRHGLEAGGGAWVSGAGWRAWVSAPQAWLGVLAPPLRRGLTLGVDGEAGDGFAGLAREAPRRGFAESASWSARAGVALGGVAVWGEFRDHPWRGGVGVSAAAGPVRCLAQVDSHPVLEPTARLVLRIGRDGGGR